MTESKIKLNKDIRQNTGAILNPAACGTSPTRNFLSVGFADQGICEYVEPTGEEVPENNAPIIDLNGVSGGLNISDIFTEGDVATAYLSTATVTDTDSDPLATLSIVGSGIQDGVSEVLVIGGTSYPLNANKTATGTAGSTTFSIAYTTSTQTFAITNNAGGTMPLADVQSLVRGLSYQNISEDPTEGDRTFEFVVNDGTDNSSTATLTITVVAVNDAPVIDLNGASGGINASGTFTEGDGATTFLTSATVTDADDTDLASITIVGTNGFGEDVANDIVSWGAVTFPSNADKTANVVAGSTTISVAFVTATKTFTCTKSGGGVIPVADAQIFVRAFAYNNTATPPDTSDRVFTFVANDGTANSTAAVLTVTVTAAAGAAPVINLGGSTGTYTQGDAATAYFGSATITDADGSTLTYIEITPGGAWGDDGSLERLLFGDASIGSHAAISWTETYGTTTFLVSHNTSTGKIRLTNNAGGTIPIADGQLALRAFTYYNAANPITPLNRTFSVVCSDGTDTSTPAVFTLTVEAPAWELMASTSAGGTANTVTSSGIDTTGANLIVVAVSWFGIGAVPTLTDSNGNTWTQRTAYGGANDDHVLYYCSNPTVGAGHTFTAAKTSSYPTISVAAFSGAASSSPYSAESGAYAAAVATAQPGSVTPAGDKYLVITSATWSSALTAAVDSGFNIAAQTNFSSGNHMGGGIAYLVQDTAAAVNPTWSGGTTSWSVALATFIPGGGASAVARPEMAQEPAIIVANGAAIDFTPTLLAGDDIEYSATNLPTGASINSSTGQVTGTLSTNGQWQMAITATDTTTNYTDTIYVPVMVYATLTTIDAAWLSSNGPAPYLLTGDNTVFQLDADVTENEEAFVFQGNNQALDVAGNTLTYNNASANTIPNQDLDTFTGSDPDNWTITGDAAHTSVAKASSFVAPKTLCEGDNALRVTIAQQTLTAGTMTAGSPTNIQSTGHGLSTGDAVIIRTFTATVNGTNLLLHGGYTVTVVDADNFTINVNTSAVSVSAGNWIKATKIESSAVSIPTANRLYAANFNVTCEPGSNEAYDCAIAVVDDSTGLEVEWVYNTVWDQWGATFRVYNSNQSRNYAPVVIFKSGSVSAVRVQLYVASASAGTDVDICRVRLGQAYDFGVAARGNNNSAWAPSLNYSTTGWSSSSDLGPLAIIDTVGGGAITQGQNEGYRSWPILLRKNGNGATVHGFTSTAKCDDPTCILLDHKTLLYPATAATGLISNMTAVVEGIRNVCRRDSQVKQVSFSEWNGDAIVADLVQQGSPSQSLSVTTIDPTVYDSTVNDVTINPRANCINSYALYVTQGGFTANRVVVDSTQGTYVGRGVYISPGQSNTQDGVTLRGCRFRVRDDLNREGGDSFPRAMRIRNNTEADGILLNLLIENCEFLTIADDTSKGVIIDAAKINIRDEGGGMDTSSYAMTRCSFVTKNSTGTGLCESLMIGRWDGAVADLIVTDCEFASNDTCVHLHEADATIAGLTFTGSIFTKDATANPPETFATFRLGALAGSVTTDVSFTDNAFNEGTAYDDVVEIAGTHTVTIDP